MTRALAIICLLCALALPAAELELPAWPWLDDARAGQAPPPPYALEGAVVTDVTEPLGELAEGLVQVVAVDGELAIIAPGGREQAVDFSRGSVAWLPDLTRVERDQPRYVPGRFGEGLLIEYGHTMAGRNQLPASVASADPGAFEAFGEAELATTSGLQEHGLRLLARAAYAGLMAADLQIPTTNNLTFSAYVKGQAGQRLVVVLEWLPPDLPTLADPGKQPAADLGFDGLDELLAEDAPDEPTGPTFQTWVSETFALQEGWQRIELRATDPQLHLPRHHVPESTRPVRLKMLLAEPGEVVVDALMLESHAGYGGRLGASTWVPGGRGRSGEIVRLPPLQQTDDGTIAFWFQLRGDMHWRNLLTLGDGSGWHAPMRIDLYDQETLTLSTDNNDRVVRQRLPERLAPGTWHHLAVTWAGGIRRVYLNGRDMMTLRDAPSLRDRGSIYIGGVGSNFSPAVRADAVVDDVGVWQRALSAEAIAGLAAREQPLSAGIGTALTVRDLEPSSAFPRDYRRRVWPLEVRNRGAAPITGASLAWEIAGALSGDLPLPELAAGTATPIYLDWSPALLLPGEYTMRMRLTGVGATVELERAIVIVPPRPPAVHTQIITWGGNGEAMAVAGITVAGLTGVPLPKHLDQASQSGLYAMTRIFLHGRSDDPADKLLTAALQPHNVDQRSDAAIAEVAQQAAAIAEELRRLPDLRYAILNTEHLWVWGMDFREATRQQVLERFGLDLEPWLAESPDDVHRSVHPGGRLSARRGGIEIPADGAIALDDPFYAFHRWWHSDAPGNEIFLNEGLAETFRAASPTLQTIVEPVLRRPPVRTFSSQDIIEEWYYYGNPARGISVQEELTAAARGTSARIHGMPQFLLKPGMAAPYAAMPTAHMFRETVWHCLARPLAGLTYWNLWTVLNPPDDAWTHDRIQANLRDRLPPDKKDAALDYATVRSLVKADSEESEFRLHIPELADEVTRLHAEVVHPLAALWPRWQNQPRRIAVYNSFAGALFNEIRWTHGGGLNGALLQLSHPWDMLYDQDFEGTPDPLAGYRVLIIPQAPALTQPAMEAVKAFIANGGTVIVDSYFSDAIEGVQRFDWRDNRESRTSLTALAVELITKYGRPDHPQVVEGMAAAAEQLGQHPGPTREVVELIDHTIEAPVRIGGQRVYYNLLQAAGAEYLVIVNGLRGPGRYYGHFGRVLEDGIAQNVTVNLPPAWSGVIYSLPDGELLTAQGQLELALPPGGGRILMHLPTAIERLELTAPQADGDLLTVSGRLLGVDGQPVPGLVPLRLDIYRPDGSLDGCSRYDAIQNGEGRWSFAVPKAAVTGAWRVTIRTLAGNAVAEIEVAAPH